MMMVVTLLAVVQALEFVAFVTLAIASVVQWARWRGESAAWLAATFGMLAVLLPLSWLTPAGAEGPAVEVIRRSLAVLLALFPYGLFRFTGTFSPGSARTERLARAGTAVVVGLTVVLPGITAPEGTVPAWYVAYAVAFVVDWTALALISVLRLWRAGRGQPAVARRRMHLMGFAALVLNVALLVVAGSGGRGSGALALTAQIGGLVSAVLFLLGFVPPRVLRARWRRPEMAALQAAEAELMTADTGAEVAALVLPRAAGLIGGRAAVLVEQNGWVRAHHGTSEGEAGEAEVTAMVEGLPTPAGPDAQPVTTSELVAVPARGGWLVVGTTAVTPVFGSEEVSLLQTLAHLGGLALDRAESYERERQGRQALADREALLAEAQRTARLGSYAWDLTTREARWSDEMHRLLGFQPGAVEDKAAAFASRIHPDDRDAVLTAWQAAATSPEPDAVDYRIVLPDGEVRWLHGQMSPVVGEEGRVVRVAGTIQDITDRKRAEEEMAFQASHDGLTQLPNRTLLLDRLGHALARRQRRPMGIAVLFVDLDRFKWLNDSLGHAAGDEALLAVASRLDQVVRTGDTLARFGGDEFVILCEDLDTPADAELVARRVRAALAVPFLVAGEDTTLTASVGIAHLSATTPAETAEALVRDADVAMYRAKERGRDRYEVFDIVTRLDAIARHETTNALRRGLTRGEVVPYYQPLIDLTGGGVAGVEALARWHHPERGVLPPAQFIPLAEETGLVLPLGAEILREACRQVAAWARDEHGPGPLSLSVNLAPRQLLAPDMTAVVEEALEASGLDPSLLCLEIVESVLLEDSESSARALGQLRALGVRIGVDDFGTGFSALTYLKRFPVDVLKIDRSFVQGIGRDREDRAIVANVVDLAHALGLRTVAEGVETTEQLAELRRLGCELGQGFLWSPPVPPAQAAEWMVAHGPAAPSPAFAPHLGAGPRRLRVLVVDDDSLTREVLRMVLEDGEHFEVVGEAADGREAVAVARHRRPDIVLLDLAMPGIGGLEALPLIHAMAPDARIVILSSLDAADYAPAASDAGVAGFLSKGRDLAALPAQLEGILSRLSA